MSSNTPNLGLLKKDPMVDGNETFNIQTMLNDNWDRIDEAVGKSTGYGLATQTATDVYEVALSPAPSRLSSGLRVTVKVEAASAGAPTLNINGLGARPALKASGSPASLKAGGVYTLVYDGTAFILQGEGGEIGTATAGDVRQGKTVGTEEGLTKGILPVRNTMAETIVPGTTDRILQPGIYDHPVTIKGDPDKVPGNIRGGVEIDGVQGKASVVDTADATATAATILTGQSGYVNGQKVIGTMTPKPPNMLKYGDFNNEGWNLTSGTGYSPTTYKYPGHSLYVNGQITGETTVESQELLKTVAGRKYYLSCWVNPTVASSVQLYARIDEPSISASVPPGTWSLVSGVLEFASTMQSKARVDNNTNSGIVHFDGFMIIDLTEFFGADKEPDKATMDSLVQAWGGYWNSPSKDNKLPINVHVSTAEPARRNKYDIWLKTSRNVSRVYFGTGTAPEWLESGAVFIPIADEQAKFKAGWMGSTGFSPAGVSIPGYKKLVVSEDFTDIYVNYGAARIKNAEGNWEYLDAFWDNGSYWEQFSVQQGAGFISTNYGQNILAVDANDILIMDGTGSRQFLGGYLHYDAINKVIITQKQATDTSWPQLGMVSLPISSESTESRIDMTPWGAGNSWPGIFGAIDRRGFLFSANYIYGSSVVVSYNRFNNTSKTLSSTGINANVSKSGMCFCERLKRLYILSGQSIYIFNVSYDGTLSAHGTMSVGLASNISVDKDGNIVIGHTDSAYQLTVKKFNGNGDLIASSGVIQTLNSTTGQDVHVEWDQFGNIYLAYTTISDVVMLRKFDVNFNSMWEVTIGNMFSEKPIIYMTPYNVFYLVPNYRYNTKIAKYNYNGQLISEVASTNIYIPGSSFTSFNPRLSEFPEYW